MEFFGISISEMPFEIPALVTLALVMIFLALNFEGIFGTSVESSMFEDCTLQNVTENFSAVDIYEFECA